MHTACTTTTVRKSCRRTSTKPHLNTDPRHHTRFASLGESRRHQGLALGEAVASQIGDKPKLDLVKIDVPRDVQTDDEVAHH